MIINNNCIAKQLLSIKEIYSAIELGLNIYISYLSESEDSTPVEYTDMPDDKIIEEFKNGCKIYAGVKTLNGIVLPSAQTILTSKFYIGNTVYFLDRNKVYSGEIVYISLSKGKNELYNRGYILENLYYNIQNDKSIESMDCNTRDSLERLTKDLFSTSYAVVKVDHYNYHKALPVGKIFKTKQELINSL